MNVLVRFFLGTIVIGCLISCSKEEDEPSSDKLKGAKIAMTGNNGNDYRRFVELFFVDKNIGYVTSFENNRSEAGQIFKTTDGGISWMLRFDEFNELPYNMHFQNEFLGGFISYHFNENHGIDFNFFRTTDGGNKWLELPLSNIQGNVNLEWVDDRTMVYSVTNNGSGSIIHRSIDTGKTWGPALMNEPAQDTYLDLQMINESEGVGFSETDMYITTDGGLNWLRTNDGMFAREINFKTLEHGIIVTSQTSRLTRDGGSTWDFIGPTDSGIVDRMDNPCFVDQNVVFFSGEDGIYKSIDGGFTYEHINKLKAGNKYYEVIDLFMVDNNVGFATGLEHLDDSLSTATGTTVILKTTTGWE